MMRMLLLLGVLPFVQSAIAQPDSPEVVYVSDTMLQVHIPKITIYAPREFQSKYDQQLFYSLRRKVLKTYPYALEAAKILIEVDQALQQIEKKRDRKKYLKSREKEIEARFEDPLKDMTTGEGKVLIKLVNRETGNTAFQLIKELKGGMDAFFYQNLGKLWGYDLKEAYDPAVEPDIEFIIRMIESGAPGYELRPLPDGG
jgi:hypothetical protein